MQALACTSCTLDGGAVVLDENGALPIFDRLRYGARVKPEALLYAFDLLELDGADLRDIPIEARRPHSSDCSPGVRARSRGKSRPSQAIHLVEHEASDSGLLFEHACQLGCEGIVSKLKGSRYTSGRTRDWIKVKNPNAPRAKRLEDEDWNETPAARQARRNGRA